jgi:hypothetical protein
MNVQPVNQRTNLYKRSAANGAIMTVSVLGLSTTIDYFLRPQVIKATVDRLGGTNKYIKNFLLTAGVFAAIGAAANTATTFIFEKMSQKK